MKTNSTILIEGAVFGKPEKVKTYRSGKVTFDAYLQEHSETNQNKRHYTKEVLDNGMSRISDKIRKRGFIGELDHPITDDQIRQTTVMYKEGSHIIREWGWDGPFIRGVIETTPYTQNGKSLSGYVMDGVPVGFSLRGLADLEDMGRYQMVLDPLLVIAFDCVSEPSHTKATIQEIRNENVVRVVNESKQLICCSNGVCYLPNYFDELIESRILKLDKYCNL
tara:strand:- start:210 stop:875 length:666 start_codon:yes stop_codon:yes gene_type:complete